MRTFGTLCLLTLVVTVVIADPVWATSTGTKMPWESPFESVRNSITGPVAFTLAIFGMVLAGGTLIFGGDLSGFFRTTAMVILAATFLVAAVNLLEILFPDAKGAVIAEVMSRGCTLPVRQVLLA